MITPERYEILFLCFVTEQMSAAQMREHMAEDEVFAKWMERRLAERRSAAKAA